MEDPLEVIIWTNTTELLRVWFDKPTLEVLSHSYSVNNGDTINLGRSSSTGYYTVFNGTANDSTIAKGSTVSIYAKKDSGSDIKSNIIKFSPGRKEFRFRF